MENISVVKTIASPAPRPQSLAYDGTHFWMGSMETCKIYKIDPSDWSILWETEAPGIPFGITVVSDELRVLCGETEEDYRFIRRLIPGEGIDPDYKLPCPDDTGSQLGYNGQKVHVSQWYNKQVHQLSECGEIEKTYNSPHGIAGNFILDGSIYTVTTDAEETNEFFLTKLHSSGDADAARDLARISFGARALAYDGENFWTNNREEHEIVCFRRPE